MCTVSLSCRREAYELWFNRDEQHSRGDGIAPSIGGTSCRWIGPRDADAGGTWIGCNEHGLTMGLLNLYEGTVPKSAAISRGRLVSHLLDQCHDTATAVAHWKRLDLGNFAPHRLLMVARGESMRVVRWDGRARSIEERVSPSMLTSSSVDSAAIGALREARWRALAGDGPVAQAAFHFAHDDANPAAGVLMHRADARTVSITHIAVSADRAIMRYWPIDRAGVLEPEHRIDLALLQSTGRV